MENESVSVSKEFPCEDGQGKMRIAIGMRCPSWNDMQRAHFIRRWNQRDDMKEEVYASVLEQFHGKHRKIAETFAFPIRILVEAHYTGSVRHDPDNLYVKPILDALVDMEILPDDNGEVIRALVLAAKNRMERDQVLISIF
jgi:Holliday junction resolvase RusA-like endonuclease